jgi:hypothetical protein
MLPYAKHLHSFHYVCDQLPFEAKGETSALSSEEHGTFILAVKYEIRTRRGHSAYMLCCSFPDKLTKWVFSDAVHCSNDMGKGYLHFGSIKIYRQVQIYYHPSACVNKIHIFQ